MVCYWENGLVLLSIFILKNKLYGDFDEKYNKIKLNFIDYTKPCYWSFSDSVNDLIYIIRKST